MRLGFGSVRDIDETEYESLMEVLHEGTDGNDPEDPDDLVLREIREQKQGR